MTDPLEPSGESAVSDEEMRKLVDMLATQYELPAVVRDDMYAAEKLSFEVDKKLKVIRVGCVNAQGQSSHLVLLPHGKNGK